MKAGRTLGKGKSAIVMDMCKADEDYDDETFCKKLGENLSNVKKIELVCLGSNNFYRKILTSKQEFSTFHL